MARQAADASASRALAFASTTAPAPVSVVVPDRLILETDLGPIVERVTDDVYGEQSAFESSLRRAGAKNY